MRRTISSSGQFSMRARSSAVAVAICLLNVPTQWSGEGAIGYKGLSVTVRRSDAPLSSGGYDAFESPIESCLVDTARGPGAVRDFRRARQVLQPADELGNVPEPAGSARSAYFRAGVHAPCGRGGD